MASEAEEVAALDRILTRLALTENEELGQLLSRLLPALVGKLSTQQAAVRAKVLELLSHINKRVKASQAIPLPLAALAAAAALPGAPPAPLPTLFTPAKSSTTSTAATPATAAVGQAGAAGSPLVRSFGLVYVDLALPRATPAEQLAAVPQLLWGVASRPAQPRAMALRLATAALATGLGGGSSSSNSTGTSTSSSNRGTAGGVSAAAPPAFTPSANPGPREAAAVAALLPPAKGDQEVLLEYALKVLLYQRPTGGAAGRVLTPLAAAQAAAGGAAAAEAASAAVPPPPGLSPADVAELTQTGIPDQEALLALKLGLLGLIGAAALTPAPLPAEAAGAGAEAPGTGAAAEAGGDAMDTDEGPLKPPSSDETPPPPTTTATPAGAGASSSTSSSAGKRAAMLLPPEMVLPHLLVAACDPYEPVARRGEDLLRKVCNPEAATPGVNLEEPTVVTALVRLLLGGDAPASSAAAAAPGAAAVASLAGTAGGADGGGKDGSGAAPVGAALAVRIMQLLVRSMTAASSFPANALILSHCLYGPSAASVALGSSSAATGANARLQQLGMEWSVWVFKHAPSWQLKALAPAALQRLLPALDGGDPMEVDGPSGGRGGGSSLSSPLVRGSVYQALATLSRRVPEVFQADPTIAASFFAGLTREPPGARAAVQEALGVLAGAYQAAVQSKAGDAGSTGRQLEELLATSIKSDQPAVRLCAVQWAVRLFPPSHLPSRHICILAAGDTKPEVRELGLNGLGLGRGSSPYAGPPAAAAGGGDSKQGGAGAAELPNVAAVVGYFRGQYPALAGPADVNRPLLLQPRSFEALIAWMQRCWRAQPKAATAAAPATTGGEASPEAHLQLLEHALVTAAPRELVTEALEALVDLGGCDDSDTRRLLEQRYAQRLPWLLPWLAHHHHPARTAAARLTGIAAAGLVDPAAALQLLQGTLLAPWDKEGAAQAGGTVSGSASSASSATLEAREGYLLAAGYVGAQCAAAGPTLPPAAISAAAATLAGVVAGPGGKQGGSNILAAAAGYALGCWGLTGRLPDLSSVITAAAGEVAADKAATSNGSSSSSQAYTSDDPAVAGSLVTLLQPLLADKDVKVVTRAVTALGYAGYGEDRSAVQSALAAALLQLARSNKSEEVMLTVGEALALLLGGPASGASVRALLRSNASSLGQLLEEEVDQHTPGVDQSAATGTGDAMEVDEPAAGSSGQPQVDQVDRTALWSSVLPQLLDDMAVAPQPEVRCATCVALVSLARYCGACPPLAPRLPALQSAFTALLGDANELTQDMASRGISLVYKLGGEELQGALLRQLVGVLGGDKGAAPGGGAKVTGDTKIFEEGALGSAPGGGGGLTTYKELCSLATDIGQPDLVYKFMDLARHSAAVTSRRGAAAGVAGIARLVGEQGAGGGGKGEGGALAALLGQERLAALLPKLYRSQYDPSPRVAEAMKGIWVAMVDDTRATLDRYYEPLLKELLRAAGARLWRERQAAAAGLADLLQGRRWSQLAGHMAEVWTMVLRLVDDVKASVREAGAGTLRSLRGLSLRLMDAAQTPAADVAGCCCEVLPLLAGPSGLASSVPEVRGVALTTIATAVKTAGAPQVRPLLPALVPVLLESLSGLEDARLNYVEQNAERYGLDSSRLDAVRVAASRSSPAAEALEVAARACDAATAPALVTQLVTLVRRGVGLNTKAGTARFIRTLTSRLGADLQPAAPPLLKALVAAVTNERSSGVRKAYAAAAAEVVLLTGEKRRDKFVADALSCYPTASAASASSSESSASEDQRLAGALLLGALLKASPDKFAPYAPQVLPVAFAARLDTSSPEVAAAWGLVWTEGAPSEGAALRAYGAEVLGVLLGGLGASAWGHKAAAAKAISELVKAAGSTLPDEALTRLTKGLLVELAPPRLWEGKQALLEALGAVGAVAAAKGVKDPGLEPLVSACLAAAGRKKKVYRNAGLAALHTILTALVNPSGGSTPGVDRVDQTLDVYALVAPLLLGSIQQHVEKPEASSSSKAAAEAVAAQLSSAAAGGGKEGGADGAGGEEAPQPLPLAECLSTLALAWRAAPPATAHTPAATATLTSQLYRLLTSPGQPWQGWLAGVTAAKEVAPQGAAGSQQGFDPSQTWSADSWWPQGLTLLVAGVLHVLEHANVMQLRLECLATLTALLSASSGGARLAAATPVMPANSASSGPAAGVAAGGAGAEAVGGGGPPVVDPQAVLGRLRALLQQLCGGGAEQAPPALKAAAAATLQQLAA